SMWMFPTSVVLDTEGLTCHCGPWKYRRPWTAVSNFTTDDRLKGRWTMVVHDDRSGGQPLMRLVARSFGRDALLGVKAGISAPDLAALLNLWRERALQSQG